MLGANLALAAEAAEGNDESDTAANTADAHAQRWPPAFARGMLWRHIQDASVVFCTRCIGSHVLRFMAAPGDGLETERSPRWSKMSARAEQARVVEHVEALVVLQVHVGTPYLH